MALYVGLRGAHLRIFELVSLQRANKLISRFMTRPYTSFAANTGVSQATATARPIASSPKLFLPIGWSGNGHARGPQGLQLGPARECSMFYGHSEASPGKGIGKVKLTDAEGAVEVEWSAGGVSKYPYVWLRDNCQCPMCYESEYGNRLILTSELDTEIVPARAETRGTESALHVTWPDGHQSRYDWQWLRDRCFSSQARADRERRWKNMKQLWGADILANLPKFEFPALLTDDRALYDFMYTLDTVGLALVQNMSRDVGQVKKLANRVSFLKPSVQMQHFIQQTEGEGGTSHLADGFHAACQLREENPEAFRLLNTFKHR
ncbi:gamma-butyrobetaine dioxygenase-like [Branchiostoma floridae]|uniref:Gamma-butyrobetaine dioxygenase-like n=1 Tax=Branchiostoma floridae TaxID=7739 RepID=A0A9J7KYW7_BRAFL|nr:gamma-butyrobetaine dioxygenase-like [Branchiostoma floridae]